MRNINITGEMLETIKKVDIREFLESNYGSEFHGPNCRCPHPDHDDRNPSFSVWKDRAGHNYWCCHSCHCGQTDRLSKNKNYGTDIIALLQWLSDYDGSDHILSFQEAAVKIMEYANIPYSVSNTRYDKTYKLNRVIAESCNKALKEHIDSPVGKYLLNRGLDIEDIKTWQIGFNGERIVFPLLDKNKRIIAFSNRVVDEAPKTTGKYVNSRNSQSFNKSAYLYGIHNIDKSLDYIYICEGQMDVIMATKYGLKNVVAPLGTAFTKAHIETIRENFPGLRKLIYTFDADEAGRKALKRSAALAREEGYTALCCNLPEGQDLCEYAVYSRHSLQKNIVMRTEFYFCHELKDVIAGYDTTLVNAQNDILTNFMPVYNITKSIEEKQAIEVYLQSRFNILIPKSGENYAEKHRTEDQENIVQLRTA